METFLIFFLSVFFSAFGTVVGFGGGIFVVPVLILFFNVPINIAVGSVMIALFPGAFISTLFNHKNNKIDYKAGILLEIPTIIGTVLGSFLTSVIPLFSFKIIFAVFIGYIGIYTFRKGKKKGVINKNGIMFKLNSIGPRIIQKSKFGAYRISMITASFFGSGAGLMAGLFGIGGGFLKTPIMVNVFKMPPSVAAATALFMIVFTSATGSVSHYLIGHIDFMFALPIILGFITGAFIGNKLNLNISEKTLAKLIGFGLLLAAAAVLTDTLFIKRG